MNEFNGKEMVRQEYGIPERVTVFEDFFFSVKFIRVPFFFNHSCDYMYVTYFVEYKKNIPVVKKPMAMARTEA